VTSEIGITANNGVTGGQLTVPMGFIVVSETDSVKQKEQRAKDFIYPWGTNTVKNSSILLI